MKKRNRLPLLLMGLVCCLVMGCGVDSATDAGTKQPSALKAPEDYVRGALGARDRAADVVGTGAINKAIEAYKMEYGTNPTSLEELRKKGLLSTIPPAPAGKTYQYNPRNGTVALVDK